MSRWNKLEGYAPNTTIERDMWGYDVWLTHHIFSHLNTK